MHLESVSDCVALLPASCAAVALSPPGGDPTRATMATDGGHGAAVPVNCDCE